MISNINNITHTNISNDWGWYVDIENCSHINSNTNIHRKKIVNILPSIDESIDEECNCHLQNYKDVECLDDAVDYEEFDKKNFYEKYFIYKIGSTTLITSILIYAIFFLI